jgi:N-acetylglucosamine-6-phosphate deacetylase
VPDLLAAADVHGVDGPARVVVEGGWIVAVERLRGRAPERILAPGFVDLQCNGMGDVDVATADGDDWDRLDDLVLAGGVTTWCPTLVTAPLDDYPDRLARVEKAAGRPPRGRPAIAGAHLEGPFLGGAPGAHRRDWLQPIDHAWLAALPDVVRIVTLAPELDGAVEAVRLLATKGVLVAVGHSAATEAQVAAAEAAGARMVTHLFNGMPPFHHRDPGLAGATLTRPGLAAGLIADLVHIHPTALALAFRAKGPDAVALVTDAVATAGLDVTGGAARLPGGTLAGSVLDGAGGVRNVVQRAGVRWPDAVTAASTTPARLLGLADRGRIAPGLRADLVALTPDLEVEATIVGGEVAWPRS